MERFNSSDTLGAMVSICPPNVSDEGGSKTNNGGYSREFQAMLDSFDEDDGAEETSITNGKKRRLSLEKVKALERHFEVDNKLEPDKKAKIAEELNLQPRQVAIWFQNRRARWKAKQLEKDYGFLKSDYDALKHNYECLEREKSTLNAEVRELKSKLGVMNENGDYSVKEEALFSESENNNDVSEQSKISPGGFCGESDSNNNILGLKRMVEFKDGYSDSDSSEMQILNDTNQLHHHHHHRHHHHHQWIPPTSSSSSSLLAPGLNFSSSSSSSPMNWFQFPNTREIAAAANANQQQFGKVEEPSFYGMTEEESCSFFPLDQPPTMHWYNLDQ